jgi:hypothetical protein
VKNLLFILILLFLTAGLPGEKAHRISGLGRPVGLEMDKNQLYILENSAVSIYSLKDFRLINKFGQSGQGPGEFATLPHVHITLDCSTDKLIIGSIRKISIYSKQGRFISERKAHNLAYRLVVMDTTPGRERFLGWSRNQDGGINTNTIVVFDSRLNKIKQVYRDRDPFQGRGKGYDMLPKTFSFLSHRGKILLPGRDDASIDVLNLEMKPLFTIRIEQEPLRVSEDFKRKMIHYLKTSPETKNVFPILQPIRFPKTFPGINSFFADQGIIYVMSWKREKGNNEFFTYNLEGKFLRRIMLPIRYETDIQTYPTIIKNGHLVQLVENELDQEWELRISEIK